MEAGLWKRKRLGTSAKSTAENTRSTKDPARRQSLWLEQMKLLITSLVRLPQNGEPSDGIQILTGVVAASCDIRVSESLCRTSVVEGFSALYATSR